MGQAPVDGPGPGEVQHGPSLRGGIEAPGPRRPLASARPIDVRFLAPHPVGRVALVDVPAAVTAACEAAGLDVVTDRPELVVTSRRSARRAARLQGQSVVALGPARRALTAAGYAVETFVVRRGPLGPRLVVPLRPPTVADSVLLTPMTGHWGPKRVATRAVLSALRLGLPVGEVVTLGTRVPGLPALLAAATEVGLPPLATWHLRAGEGDDLQRLVWLCSALGSTEPGWAVKTTRLRGYSTPFDRDAEGLALLTPTPAAVRGHAPTLLGSIEVDGVHGAVETAAAGLPLHDVLGGLDRAAHAVPLIRSIARWAIDLAAATVQPPAALGPELERLRTLVLPAWSGHGVVDLVGELPPLVAVVQHGDLGLWNIVGHATGFTVIDWESARPAGLPLWDVAYFLADALGFLARPGADDERKLEAMIALLRGELDTSPVLFELLAAAASKARVPAESVGAVVTLGWLHHGLSAAARTEQRAGLGAGAASSTPALTRALAHRWLTDPELGTGWRAFRRWAR